MSGLVNTRCFSLLSIRYGFHVEMFGENFIKGIKRIYCSLDVMDRMNNWTCFDWTSLFSLNWRHRATYLLVLLGKMVCQESSMCLVPSSVPRPHCTMFRTEHVHIAQTQIWIPTRLGSPVTTVSILRQISIPGPGSESDPLKNYLSYLMTLPQMNRAALTWSYTFHFVTAVSRLL